MHAIRAKMVPYLRLETLTNHTLYTLLSYIGVATRVTYESWSQVSTVLSELGMAITYYVQQRV